MFITFEGIDCSGKSTQAQLLVERLHSVGKKVLLLREPGGTPVSEKIRTILLDRQHREMNPKTELLLFSAARSQLVHQIICPALREGSIVICDRFFDSTTAYQGYGRNIDLQEILALNRIATSGTIPDLTVLVDIEVKEILRRRLKAGLSADRMESSGEKFYERVRSGYRAIAGLEPRRVVMFDGMQAVEVIHKAIWSSVQKVHSLIGG